ncbi:NAD(P)-binding domain-containing protein [Streptomyces sp. PTY087I2]|uniref:imine reductase family protein n=1 Tax=Streptomyces sp. PTY087I2 TaxID=1819298 RepID=UPI0009A047A6|nr:NAD(P)-binding domain-containing protein [Streptomyces sp. PTY087I2]
MGSALAATLLERGHPTTVRPTRRRWSTGARGRPRYPRRPSRPAPPIIVCVLDHDALHATLDAVADSLAGKSLVNLTSGSPGHAQEAAAWARSHSVDYLDGAIMTTPPGVGSPEMMFLYSGSRTVLYAHRPALEALGGPLHLGTEPGLASLYDAALLGLDNALPELLKATMERTRDAGHGSSSYASVIEVLRKGVGGA